MIRHRSASTSFLQKTFRDTGCLIALIAATCRGHAKMSTFAVSGTGQRCYIKGLRPVFLRRKVARSGGPGSQEVIFGVSQNPGKWIFRGRVGYGYERTAG